MIKRRYQPTVILITSGIAFVFYDELFPLYDVI